MKKFDRFTDFELADFLRLGDEEVFRVIYERYWDKMFFVAAKKLNNTFEAEEVVQEVFLNLWKKREVFHLKVAFENYLSVATRFEVYKRRAQRLKQSELNKGFSALTDAQEFHDHNLYDFNELRERIDESISTLPPKCKLVFTMSRGTDLTNKNIGVELGISEKAVEKHITNAIKILKSRFKNHFSVKFYANNLVNYTIINFSVNFFKKILAMR